MRVDSGMSGNVHPYPPITHFLIVQLNKTVMVFQKFVRLDGVYCAVYVRRTPRGTTRRFVNVRTGEPVHVETV